MSSGIFCIQVSNTQQYRGAPSSSRRCIAKRQAPRGSVEKTNVWQFALTASFRMCFSTIMQPAMGYLTRESSISWAAIFTYLQKMLAFGILSSDRFVLPVLSQLLKLVKGESIQRRDDMQIMIVRTPIFDQYVLPVLKQQAMMARCGLEDHIKDALCTRPIITVRPLRQISSDRATVQRSRR